MHSSQHSLQGSYLFQRPFYFYTMTPGYSWICKTISSISSSGDLNPLFTQITKSFCHHLNSIIGQSRCVLKRSENIWLKTSFRFTTPSNPHSSIKHRNILKMKRTVRYTWNQTSSSVWKSLSPEGHLCKLMKCSPSEWLGAVLVSLSRRFTSLSVWITFLSHYKCVTVLCACMAGSPWRWKGKKEIISTT